MVFSFFLDIVDVQLFTKLVIVLLFQETGPKVEECFKSFDGRQVARMRWVPWRHWDLLCFSFTRCYRPGVSA
jgi:hypothetical protein